MHDCDVREKKVATHFCVATSSLGGVHRVYPCARIVTMKCTKAVKYGELTAGLALFPGVGKCGVTTANDEKFLVGSILGNARSIDNGNVIGSLNG